MKPARNRIKRVNRDETGMVLYANSRNRGKTGELG
jgi:hypothetical protein